MAPDDADDALSAFAAARQAVVPYIGERAEALLGHRVAEALGDTDAAARFRARLVDDDPVSPQVTEAERLLLDWATAAAEDDLPVELERRRDEEFSPSLCAALDDYVESLRALSE